jgi:DNA helicase-2/ATP-dependent DNA helicase PcrA
LTLKSQAEEKTLPGLERQNFRRFYEIISKALELSGRVSVRALIDHLLKESDFYKSLTQIPEDQANEKVAKLQILLKIIERFENEQDANSVADFLEYLEAVEQSGESFDSEQSDENCVSLLTVHSSKGLEFDTVFMVGLVQEKFPARNKSEPFSVPEALLKENLPESGEKNLQEERRLFYVAATRAKKRLFLSHAQKYSESRKVWKSSIFLSEAAVETYLKFNHESTENEFQFAKPKVEFADLTPPKIIKRFSYSQFEAFSSCPQKYKFRYICKIPTPQSHVLNFGVSIHNALNDFYSAVKQGRAAEIDLLLQMFERNWIKSGYETKDLHDFKKAEGRKMLEAYYEANKENFGQSVFLERPFTVKFGDFTITGRIDRIDKLPDGTYEIIDYKTGNSKKAQDVDKDLQLTLYAIAAKDVFEIPVSALSLYFVKENQKLTTRRKEQDLEKAKSKLQETVNKITQSDFAPTPGLSCKYCDYRNICESAV